MKTSRALRWGKIIGLLTVLALVGGWAVRTGLHRLTAHRLRQFEAQAEAARKAGQGAEAVANFQSALALNPQSIQARIGLVQAYLDDNRFDDAVAAAEPLQGPAIGAAEQIVHDSLLLRRDFVRLAHFSAGRWMHGATPDPRWLRVMLQSAWIAELQLPEQLGRTVCGQALVAAHNAQLRKDLITWDRALNQCVRDADTGAETLLTLEALLRRGDADRASLLLARQRHRLSRFDASLIDWRLAQRRGTWEADTLLSALLSTVDSAPRRAQLMANLLEVDSAAMTQRVLRVWLASLPDWTVEELGSAWALARGQGLAPEATKLESWYRAQFGREFPLLFGEALGAADKAKRMRARSLLVGSVPMSREVVVALMRSDREPKPLELEASVDPDVPVATLGPVSR